MKEQTVLVIDDNPTSRDILQDMLTSFSFTVTLAASGADGLNELERAPDQAPYELVVVDWRMPGMDGIETARQIRRLRPPGFGAVPRQPAEWIPQVSGGCTNEPHRSQRCLSGSPF